MLKSVLSVIAATVATTLPQPAGSESRGSDPLAGVQFAQMTIQQRIIIHVPRMSAPPAPVVWKEHGGPKCLAAASLAGALIAEPKSVDLVVAGGKRYRAKLDGDCSQLDFYSGFYIRPASDGKVCADRDAIRVRSGASCEIDKFRELKPEH